VTKHRILIVDDDQAIADTLQEWLEMNGYEVTVAIGADEVTWLSNWQWQRYDCIVTGINQLGLNGLDFADLVISNNGPPVIVMSGYKTEDVRMKAYDIGATVFIAKPFDLRDFLKAVNYCCEKKHK